MSSAPPPLYHTAGHPATESQNTKDGTTKRLTTTDPTTSSQQPSGSLDSSTSKPTPADLTELQQLLQSSLIQYPDFPSPGILFEDILPLFASPKIHRTLITALELFIQQNFSVDNRPDVIVGLDARGFIFGPTLALQLGAGFVAIRKPGKLPGQTVTSSYSKEYGSDSFELQVGSIKKGQKVLVVDDVLATGGTAAAAGELIGKSEGILIGYLFLLTLDGLNGKAKLKAPVHTLLSTTQEKAVT